MERALNNLAGILPDVEVAAITPLIAEIEALKAKRRAVVLAHNYMTPDIFHGVADLRGDSLALARMAGETEADVIVMAGVHFMAETAKILNPRKTVLIPDLRAGCSLAESITGADVRLLRQRYPGVPVVTYVNTSADVNGVPSDQVTPWRRCKVCVRPSALDSHFSASHGSSSKVDRSTRTSAPCVSIANISLG